LNPNALVISEKFFITMNTVKMSRQDASLKTNGALEYECWKRGHAYEEQSKSTAAKMGRDVELKRLGLYVPGRGHANDAARHMVLGVNRHVPELLDNEFLAGYSGDRVTIERIT
jgi:hypothetical protein